MKRTSVFFPGLNSLRFFAALAVFFTHVELMKKFNAFGSHWIDLNERIHTTAIQSILKKEVNWLSPLIANAGTLGVAFFFVLSGFLITYLLFTEKKNNHAIAVKKFYIRRILRIWPLYYLIFILGFFILPYIPWFYVPAQARNFDENFWGNLIAYAFFLPNLAFAFYTRAVPNIGQAWSIGVEEQFYIIWPLIIKYLKKTIAAIVWFTVALLLLKVLIIITLKYYSPDWMIVVKRFFAMSKIECMSLGGIGAYFLFYKKEKWLRRIYHPVSQLLAILMIPGLIFFAPMAIQDGLHIIYGICFLVVILNVAANPKTFMKIDFKLFDFLGKISYGFYMYHVMMINLSLHALYYFFHLNKDLSAFENVVVYAVSFITTVIVSSLSYYFFEQPFIKLKKKVTTVQSGNEVTSV